MVQNYGQKPRSLYVTLSMRNVVQPLASRRIDLGPGERSPVVLGFEPARGDVGAGLIVEISPHDALVSDDRAYGRVPSGAKLSVVMAPAKGSPWVARALASDPNVELLGSSLSGLASAGVPRDALVVVSGACPTDAPGGDLLILDPPPGPCGTSVVGAKLETPAVTSWAEVDPRLRFLSLDGVELHSAHRLEADTPQAALVRSREGTLIADASSPGRSVTVVGFDVGDSNWPLRASFVLFMRNVVELARSHRARGAEAPGRTGDAYSLRVPIDVSEVDLESPSGEPPEATRPRRSVCRAESGSRRLLLRQLHRKKPGQRTVCGQSDQRSRKRSEATRAPRTARSAAAGPQRRGPGIRRDRLVLAAGGARAAADCVRRLVGHAQAAPASARPAAPAGARRGGPAVTALRHTLRALAALPLVLFALGRFPSFYLPYLRFERPLLALPAAAIVWFVLSRLARLSIRQHRARRGLQTLLCGAAALCAAYALIGVELGRPLDRLAVIVAIDRSRSIDLVPGADARIASELRVAEIGMREHDQIGTIAFGASAAVEDPLRERSLLPAPQRAEIGRDGTDIGAALRRALGEVPADAAARIVILSDGVATRGDTLSAAAAAVAAGVAVDVVPLDQAKVPDVRITSVRTAPRANAGEALDLRIVTESTSPAEVELRVIRDGQLIRKGQAKIGAGEDVLHLREVAEDPRISSLRR